MHTLVHSIPSSPEWHLSYLLKAFIVSRNVSKDTPTEVILNLCHLTQVVIKTDGDPKLIEKVVC